MNVNFLTGPVTISKAVQTTFAQMPISHRSDEFIQMIQTIKSEIKSWTKCKNVELMSGSGTLANEAIAQQIKLLHSKGLILSNGIFGNRLINQATQIGLDFDIHTSIGTFDFDAIEKHFLRNADIKWIWMVIHETSIGIWNDYHPLATFCKQNAINLALDGISAIGVQHLDLQDVYLCSGVSGKAIASYPGIGIVMSNQLHFLNGDIPQYLNLHFYQQTQGIPFTINSNLVAAFHQALTETINIDFQKSNKEMVQDLSTFIQSKNWEIINSQNAAPNIITFQLPADISSLHLGNSLEAKQCNIGYKSQYLLDKNWMQIFLTRNNTMEEVIYFKSLINQEVNFYNQEVAAATLGVYMD